MRRFFGGWARFGKSGWLLLVVLLILAACNDGGEGGGSENEAGGSAVLPVDTMAPTPTLAPGVPTLAATAGQPGETTQPGETAAPTISPTAFATPTETPEPAERLPLGLAYFFYEDYESAAREFQAALASGVLDGLQSQEALLKMGQSFYHLEQYQAAADTFSEILAQLAIAEVPTEVPTGTPTVEPSETPQPSETPSGSATPPVSGTPPGSATPEAAGTAAGEEEAEVEVGASIDLTGDSPGRTRPSDAYYWLGLAHQMLDDCPAAIGAFNAYLTLNPDMAAYVQPVIGECYLTAGNRTAAINALEAATTGEAPSIVRLNLHQRLADMYLEDENYSAAIEEYEAILSFAVTDATRGQAHYLIGTAAQSAGDEGTANENFLIAVTEYPQAFESYLSLVELVEAGFEVDPFQRGLVDFYADVYEPAVAAFTSYIEANPVHREDVHLYLGWSYEQLGNIPAAVAEMDAYIEASEPPPSSGESGGGDFAAVAGGIIEKADLQARAGLLAEAAATYQSYVARFPAGGDAPYAAWRAAELTEWQDDLAGAIALYEAMAAAYPEHEDADEALFQAGYLYREQGNREQATALWQQAAELYPSQMYGAAALLWLQKSLPAEEAAPYRERAAALTGSGYFTLRANQEAQGIAPFSPADSLALNGEMTAEQAETEEWLRTWLQLEPGTNVSEMAPEALADPALVRGVKLWRLGLREEARRELEAARQRFSGNALTAYQMALFLRDLGLYRSSIAAAEEVMSRAQVNGLTAPIFLARLAYPVYYAELVTAEAEKYGYDPLLQFSLIRQESLYESFAISTAVAQGLSQVIPDTGAYIAGQLGWPDYENEDLYRPYVGIAFGAFYLAQQLEAFDGFVPAALAAYNAGPGNAARWYSEVSDDLDRYHEVVNFAETKLYIERIYIGHVIYRHLYGE